MNDADQKSSEMKNILQNLDIKPNRKSIKMITKIVYEQGEGIEKFKHDIEILKLKRPKIPPPQPPTKTKSGEINFKIPQSKKSK